jgi:hypothetical protein
MYCGLHFQFSRALINTGEIPYLYEFREKYLGLIFSHLLLKGSIMSIMTFI